MKIAVFVLVIMVQCIMFTVQAKKLTIFLHIGVHKTGSTHVQTYLQDHWQGLEKENLCIPSTDHSGKAFAPLASDFRWKKLDDMYQSPVFWQVKNCLRKEKNVIISSELFSTVPKKGVESLKQWLDKASEGLEVEYKIIMYYREWLNFMYSWYFEDEKKYLTGVTTFSEFFSMHNVSSNDFNYEVKADNYISTFGRENMMIVDYYGVGAAKVDVAQVLICEIMGACGVTKQLNLAGAAHENPSFDMVHLHYLYLFDFYLNAKNMRRCTLDTEYLYWEAAGLANRKIKFPTMTSHFEFYQDLAVQKDKEFREKYGDLIKYGNQAENMKKIHEFHVDEVDEINFFRDSKWQEFMKGEAARLIRENKICSLEKPQMKITTGDIWKLKP